LLVKIILAAIEQGLVEAWKRACDGLEDVSVHAGSIFDVECDALVSPANSFGFMDGGIDAHICERFGWGLQDRVQGLIRSRHNGELLVGQALLVPTDDAKVPYVISAPTMRVPMGVNRTANAYLATRAVLLLVQLGAMDDGRAVRDVVKTVAFPGLGTGIGEMSPGNCAAQMRAAFDDFLRWHFGFPETLMRAAQRHFVDFMNG
jgi:O-acetyl-ADP-ribose deacetylase (regulator of RNase III)